MPRPSIKSLAALAFSLFVAAGAALAGEPKFTRVFGPEIPTGPYKHPACLADLANGDMYLVYYGGSGEYGIDTSVFGSRLKKGSSTWTAPEVIAHDPFRSAGNGVIWQSPDGLVWLFYNVRYGETWSTTRVQFKVSKDNGQTWSDASMLLDEPGSMVRGRPIVLSNGNYLLGVYHETGNDPEFTDADTYSFFMSFNPKEPTKGWTRLGGIKSPKGNLQPAAVELSPGHLIAYCRRAGDYDPKTIGYIVTSESLDGGKTWSEGKNSEFPNPNAAVDLLKLKSGNVLLIYNDSMSRRTPLTLALSKDGGKTWPIKKNLRDDPKDDYGYPIILQSSDGNIHAIYTSGHRTIVNVAVCDEDWILGDSK
jgi:predicted neuraminidase